MDDQTRLAALVDAYMTQLASVTHQPLPAPVT